MLSITKVLPHLLRVHLIHSQVLRLSNRHLLNLKRVYVRISFCDDVNDKFKILLPNTLLLNQILDREGIIASVGRRIN